MDKSAVSREEKLYLRELAMKYAEYAALPVMAGRTELWHAHNKLEAARPMIVIEIDTFISDLLPQMRCASADAKDMETVLLYHIVNHELVRDDKVIPPYFPVDYRIGINEFGLDIRLVKSEDTSGRALGYSICHPVSDLKEDLGVIRPSSFWFDKADYKRRKELAEDTFGDILPVRAKNDSLCWHTLPAYKAVKLMGLEKLMFAMMDYPDETRNLFEFIKEDIMSFVKWQEAEGLLLPNNGNDFVGGGSYGFTDELPSCGHMTPRSLWAHINSQESVGLSPDMYGEFIYPSLESIAGEFGLIYYGCCEAVHGIYEKYIRKLPGLRKLSVSRWSDEKQIGGFLKNDRVIYSRKPDPAFLSSKGFDENAFYDHIAFTLKAAKGCSIEFIYRDVYKLEGDRHKPGKAVDVIHKAIDDLWH